MTTLVAITDGTATVIGSDRMTSAGDMVDSDEMKWVCLSKGFWASASGNIRILQMIKREARGVQSVDGFLGILEDRAPQWAKPHEGAGAPSYPMEFMCAWAGGAAHIGSDLCVTKARPSWPLAGGSGKGYAQAVMLALIAERGRPDGAGDLVDIARAAVKTAGRLDIWSSGLWLKVLG